MKPDFARNDGLIRAIAQDVRTNAVLMDAFMNEEAYEETRRTRRVVYFSRSKGKLWRKGEESGNVQLLHEMRINCNRDSLLLLVEQAGGAACHDGFPTCFYSSLNCDTEEVVTIEERVFDPQKVYQKGEQS